MFNVLRSCFAIVLLMFALAQSLRAQQGSWTEYFHRGVELFHATSNSDSSRREAKEVFEKILSLKPTFAPAIAYLGFIAFDNGDTTTALSEFRKALSLDSTCAEAHIGMARLYRLRGQSNEQHSELQTAIRLAPDNLSARRELVSTLLHGEGESLLDEDRLKEAMPHLQVILQLDSNDGKAHYDLAQAYEYFKQWDSALIHYQAALRLQTNAANMTGTITDVRYDVARCLENLKRNEEALTEYQIHLAELEKTQADEQTLWVMRKKIKELQNRLKK